MRSKNILTLFLFVFITSSCVTRIDPPQEGESQLHIEMEMMRNQELTATLKTSNTLNGIFPIDEPQEARIVVREVGKDESVVLIWDESRDLYAQEKNDVLVFPGKNIKLTASIDGDERDEISAVTTVPRHGEIENQQSLDEVKYTDDVTGDKFWERTFRFSLMDLFPNQSIHYQLILEEQLSNLSITGLDSTYTNVTPFPTKLEILQVTNGSEAIRQFNHEEGLFIKMIDLESEYIEVRVRSTVPLSEDVVTRFISTNLISITEDSYEYHRGLHNILESKNSIFGEPALYRSNIEQGLGIFSACVLKNDHFYIK